MGKQFKADTEAVRNIYAHDPHFTAAEEAERFAEFDAWLAERDADKWDEGYEAAYAMARGYGHVDQWMDSPENPYRKEAN